jgi:hypothetical protein
LNSHFKILAVAAAMALLIPAGAIAKRPDDKPAKGNKHGKFEKGNAHEPKLKVATANVKGAVTANDGTTMKVMVAKASGHAKACKEVELTFDVSEARFHSADNNADTVVDAADFRVDDIVKVRAKIAVTKGRKLTCVSEGETLAAKAVHNRTTPPVDDEAEEEVVEEEPLVEEV